MACLVPELCRVRNPTPSAISSFSMAPPAARARAGRVNRRAPSVLVDCRLVPGAVQWLSSGEAVAGAPVVYSLHVADFYEAAHSWVEPVKQRRLFD